MARKNSLPGKDAELSKLIAQYEAMKAEEKSTYMDGDQLADIADRYAIEQRFQEAQEVINYGLSLHPNNTDLLIEQAYLYLDTQKIQEASELTDSIAETYASEVKILKAEILLNQGKLDAAELLLATLEDQDELDTIIEVSYLYIDMGYSEKALPWLTKGLPKYSEEEDFLAACADCYFAENQFEKAEFFYNKLIDLCPFHAPYWLGLAKSYFAEQNFAKTLEAVDFALAADEHFGEAHLMRGHCLFHLDNEAEAVAAYEKALEYKSLSPAFAYMFIGLVYSDGNNDEKAIEYFSRSISELTKDGETDSPILPDLYCNQALCLSKQGKYEEAHKFCEEAKACFPDDCEPYLINGRIYMAEGKDIKAKEQWELALTYMPDPETWHQIGTYYLEYNMLENARFCLEEALKINPEMEGINEELASICIMLKDHKAFYKYNQLSKHPINFDTLCESLADKGPSQLLDELQNFLKEIKEDDSAKTGTNDQKES
ncbi:tetratricopeptide repeat protein [Bacteroides sp.]|uniref:tetratricopeptide repeat protein n=1 Tax=Bacteroides sp. TaxID=29523 RepID=UPI002FC993FF